MIGRAWRGPNPHDPPSRTISELLISQGRSRIQFAAAAHIPVGLMRALMRDEVPMTEPVARVLAATLGVPAEFWIKSEAAREAA